jgi:hypothetical protein
MNQGNRRLRKETINGIWRRKYKEEKCNVKNKEENVEKNRTGYRK